MKKYNKNGSYTKTYIDLMKSYYKRYKSTNIKYLHQCYAKPSNAKLDAMDRIHYRSATQPHIISYNTFYFVVAYFTEEDNIEYFCVDTGRNLYVINSNFI